MDWWNSPRNISVVVDNSSWILPYAESLVAWSNENGDSAILCRSHDNVNEGDIAFYLGCINLTPAKVLQKNKINIVVHESDLPKGRGFSPMTWQILERKNRIDICLLRIDESNEKPDSGDLIYKEQMILEGHELSVEWREMQGNKTIELCQRFLKEPKLLEGEKQVGEETYYKKRGPEDSRLEVTKTIEEQFDLLRVVDNNQYPAFFEHKGHRYKLAIEKDG